MTKKHPLFDKFATMNYGSQVLYRENFMKALNFRDIEIINILRAKEILYKNKQRNLDANNPANFAAKKALHSQITLITNLILELRSELNEVEIKVQEEEGVPQWI